MYLNTSNVIVNHKLFSFKGDVFINLNTSNVIVKIFYLSKKGFNNLNTSNVKINHKEEVFQYLPPVTFRYILC